MAPSNTLRAAPANAGGDPLNARLAASSRPDTPLSISKQPVVPTLWPYQKQVIADVDQEFSAGARCVALQLPTGAGKTIVFAHLIAGAARKGKRVLILVHSQDLGGQVVKTLARFGVEHGSIIAGVAETDQPVQLASVASLVRRLPRWRDQFDLIVIDEAHHAVAGSWTKIIASQTKARILGVTATPERLDGRGLGDVFEVMVQGPTVADLIKQGFLSPFTIYAPDSAVDMAGARLRTGDYAIEDIRQRMNDVAVGDVVAQYRCRCPGVPAVAFCVDIAHSRKVAAAFQAAGFRAEHVDGDTPKRRRKALIGGLGTGDLDVLCNCSLISEGVDVPILGAAILLRPTASLALHLQQIGRALRPAPGKERAIVLDFVGNTLRHGRPDDARKWSLESKPRQQRKGMGKPTVHHCQSCGAINQLGSRTCPECGASLRARRERQEIEVRRRKAGSNPLRREIRDWSYTRRIAWAEDNEARLRQIVRVCGYHPNWVYRLQELEGAA